MKKKVKSLQAQAHEEAREVNAGDEISCSWKSILGSSLLVLLLAGCSSWLLMSKTQLPARFLSSISYMYVCRSVYLDLAIVLIRA